MLVSFVDIGRIVNHHGLNVHFIRPKKNICVFPIAWSSELGSVGRAFLLLLKPTSILLPLKSLVSFFLTTAFYLYDMQYNVIVITCVYSPFFIQASTVVVGNKHEFPDFAVWGGSETHIFFMA